MQIRPAVRGCNLKSQKNLLPGGFLFFLPSGMQVAGGAGPVDASAGCQGTVLVKKGQAALNGANGAHDPVNEEGKKKPPCGGFFDLPCQSSGKVILVQPKMEESSSSSSMMWEAMDSASTV